MPLFLTLFSSLSSMKSVAVILGSAFNEKFPQDLCLQPREIATPWGQQQLYQVTNINRPAYLIFRHGIPHRLLPNQIPYRAQAWALQELNCGALMITSSVGVLNDRLPLYRPMLVTDLIMLENRLPDGSTCTLFVEPRSLQGHLILNEGLFSLALTQQIYELAPELIEPPEIKVTFAYVGGPRGKTAAENRMWHKLGADVNSMTLAPEVVLANELEIPCVGLVVGHKYSLPGIQAPGTPSRGSAKLRLRRPLGDRFAVSDSLESSRRAMEQIIIRFLKEAKEVPFGNQIFRFNETQE